MATNKLSPRTDLSQEYLRSLLDYDAETGEFRWKKKEGDTPLVRSFNAQRAGKIAGSVSSNGYSMIWIDHRLWLTHRLAWLYVHGALPVCFVDHIDRVKTNNRIANLRLSNPVLNQANCSTQERNKYGAKGVRLRGSSWVASIGVGGGRPMHLGSFNTKEEAEAAYIGAARVMWGGHASR